MNDETIFNLAIFGIVGIGGYFLSRWMINRSMDDKLRTRLVEGSETEQQARTDAAAGEGQRTPIFQRVGQAFAKPFMPAKRETQSTLRKSLARAGIYAPSSIKVITGCKVICLVLGLALGYTVGHFLGNGMAGLSFGGIIGYLLPRMWLTFMIKKNQQALTYALPDALDLMVVCVEAGLTIDGAMQRVGNELALAHPSLSREMGIAHMETRVGLSRSEALRNLGQRTGCAALQSLAAMLIQADRFGTSIASALRVHADSLRVQRQHAAEELAAKASVKMSFPLVLFIFPATFIVLMGPTIIGLMNSDLF